MEAQILADNFGTIKILGERDCSWQRRNQKMVEEAPAPNLPDGVRARLREHALALARAAKYRNAGTAEFLLDMDSGELLFLEINARLQVEHPVTEMIFGQDLAAWQLRIAGGERLAGEMSAAGWAMEARVCAEDPLNDFLPSGGVVSECEWPGGEGIRVDSGVRRGDLIGGRYDSLAAKIVAHGKDREDARNKLARALCEARFGGPANNLSFLRELIDAPEFVAGRVTVGLFNQARDALLRKVRARRARLERAAVAALHCEAGRKFPSPGFRLNDSPRALAALGGRRWEIAPAGAGMFSADCDGERFSASDLREHGGVLRGALDGENFSATVRRGGGALRVFMEGDSVEFHPGAASAARESESESGADGVGTARAPMHAFVRTVSAKAGDAVSRGETLMTLEAMKMEIPIPAPRDGRVLKVLAAENDAVAEGAALAEIGADGADGADGAAARTRTRARAKTKAKARAGVKTKAKGLRNGKS